MNADFEGGFATDPDQVAANVGRYGDRRGQPFDRRFHRRPPIRSIPSSSRSSGSARRAGRSMPAGPACS